MGEKKKVVLITGGSSGFGRASAERFAREGAKIVIADITEKPLSGGFELKIEGSTADVITADGGQAKFVKGGKCDVTKAADVEGAVQTAVETYGRLDVMFNNAGIYRGGGETHGRVHREGPSGLL